MNAQTGIPPFLDRRPFVGSFTILNTYRNCAHQMFRRYIVKDQAYVETPEMKFGNRVHEAFELRVGGGKVLPSDMQQWESFATPFAGKAALLEQKLGVTREGRQTGFFDQNVFFRGKADLALIQDTTAYINDWKTGSGKYEDPFELATNAVLLHAKHPHLTKIVGSYTWLKENRVSQMYDLSDTATTWAEICRLMSEILAKRQTGEWEKRQSGLCGWCSVNDCEHWRERK